MSKKRGFKENISIATYKMSGVNKRAVKLKKSFDEVNKILNSRNNKK